MIELFGNLLMFHAQDILSGSLIMDIGLLNLPKLIPFSILLLY